MKTMFGATGRSRIRLVFLLVLVLALAAPPHALAHARLLRSSPEQNKAVATPLHVDLWFSELLDGQFNAISVFPLGERNVKAHPSLTRGEAKVDPRDRTHLSVALQPLPPGAYRVEWRVLSLDGHTAPGQFQFRVADSK